MELRLYVSCTSALDGGKWLASDLGAAVLPPTIGEESGTYWLGCHVASTTDVEPFCLFSGHVI